MPPIWAGREQWRPLQRAPMIIGKFRDRELRFQVFATLSDSGFRVIEQEVSDSVIIGDIARMIDRNPEWMPDGKLVIVRQSDYGSRNFTRLSALAREKNFQLVVITLDSLDQNSSLEGELIRQTLAIIRSGKEYD